jgi:hypothetical protein
MTASDIKPGMFIETDRKRGDRKRYLMFIVRNIPEESSFQVVNVEEKTTKITHYAVRYFKKVENLNEQMMRDIIKGSFT